MRTTRLRRQVGIEAGGAGDGGDWGGRAGGGGRKKGGLVMARRQKKRDRWLVGGTVTATVLARAGVLQQRHSWRQISFSSAFFVVHTHPPCPREP